MTGPPEPLLPGVKTNRFLVLSAAQVLSRGLIAPFFVLAMLERGMSLGQVGVTLAVFSGVVVVLEVPSGAVSDAFGHKTALVVASSLGLAGWVLFAESDSYVEVLSSWVLIGGARAFDSGPLEAWLVDSAPPDQREDLLAWMSKRGMVVAASLGAGALLAGTLNLLFVPWTDLSPPTLSAAYAAIAQAAMLVLVLTLLPGTAAKGRAVQWRGATKRWLLTIPLAFRATRRNKRVRWLLGAMLASGLTAPALEVFWQPRFEVLLANAEVQGWLFGVLTTVAFAAASLGSISGPFLRRGAKSDAVTAALLRIALAVTFVLLAAAPTLAAAIPVWTLGYLATGAVYPFHATMLHEAVPDGIRATAVSMNSLALQLGGIVGNILLGSLAVARGIPSAWIVSAGWTALSAAIYLRLAARTVKDDEAAD